MIGWMDPRTRAAQSKRRPERARSRRIKEGGGIVGLAGSQSRRAMHRGRERERESRGEESRRYERGEERGGEK